MSNPNGNGSNGNGSNGNGNGNGKDSDAMHPALASLLKQVQDQIDRTTAGSVAREKHQVAKAAIRQGERKKRSELRQVAALGSIRDLLTAIGDEQAPRHLQSVRDWLTVLAHSGTFGPADAVTLLAGAGHTDPWHTYLLALAVGEERSAEGGQLATLASVFTGLVEQGSDEAPALLAKRDKPGAHRKVENVGAARASARALVSGVTSGAGDDEDLSDLDEGEGSDADVDADQDE